MRQPSVNTLTWDIFFLIALIVGIWGCSGLRSARLDARLNVQTWDCGADSGNITAALKDNGTLIVHGAGAMMDYDGSQELTPWHGLKDSITAVIIKDGVTTVGRGAFGDCNALTSIVIPGSVTFIGDFAFAGSASVTIPGSVVSIGINALSRTASISVASDNPSYSSISGVLFNKTKTTLIQYPQGKQGVSYTVPNSVTSINDEAFANCVNLANVLMGSHVNTIGEFAFAFCHNLKSIAIPGSVTRIGWGAFAHSGLTSVTSLNSTPPQTIGKSPFLDISESTCLYVPENSIAAYRSADYWKDFTCIKIID